MDTRILLQVFLRTYLVGATFNTRGMQNVGLAFIMNANGMSTTLGLALAGEFVPFAVNIQASEAAMPSTASST